MKKILLTVLSLWFVLFSFGQKQANVKEQITSKRVEKNLEQLTLDQKIQLLHGSNDTKYVGFNGAGFIKGIPEYGIPDIFIADGEHGVATGAGATGLPAKVGLAATFDVEAAKAYGTVIGEDAKALGVHVMLTPRVNIARDPISTGWTNGGNYQTYGEDPHLNGMIGVGEAIGIQKNNNAIAQLKQMFGSSNGSAQGAGVVIMDKQTMHEIYLAPFEYVVKAGVGSAMTNYNKVSNTPNVADAVWTSEWGYMMNEMLRNRWGFEGFIFPDWFCLYTPFAILEGMDIEMGAGMQFGQSLKEEVLSGHISIEYINRAVTRLLFILDKFEMLGKENFRDPRGKIIEPQMREEHGKKAQYLAERAAVLLKNEDDILPIKENELEDIVVIGPNGKVLVHSVFQESAYGFEERMISPLDALKEITGKEIKFEVGNDVFGEAIPTEYLVADDGSSGLSCYQPAPPENMAFSFFNRTPDRPDYEKPIGIHKQVNFIGSNALKTGKYVWHGYLNAPEAGYYFISLQTSYPTGLEVIQKAKTVDEVSISINGSLIIDGKTVTHNPETRGAPFPSSFMMNTPEGYNNAGVYIYLTKGKHEIQCNANTFFDLPIDIRLSWVTPSMEKENIINATEAAKKAKKAVVFVWHESSSESIKLKQCQDELIFQVAKANPNTVVVINSGDPIAMPWVNNVKSIVEMWYPGQDGGRATANILLGKANPGGKLPVTFPEKIEDVPARTPGHRERQPKVIERSDSSIANFTEGINHGYRWYDENNIKPLFPFGHGLSYTSFKYSDLNFSKDENGSVQVSFKITNTGNVDGSEVPQVYIARPDQVTEGVQFSPKLLGGFTRVDLKIGETKDITIVLEKQRFCYWDIKNDDWKLPEGKRQIMLASSSKNVKLTGYILP